MTTFSLTFPTEASRRQKPPQNCPLLLSSSGFPALVKQTGSSRQYKCTYNTEFFDWDDNIQKAIATFVSPTGPQSFTSINGECSTTGKNPIECTNWNALNLTLLPNYCTRNSYLGDCPPYNDNLNYFNPNMPPPEGCSKMLNVSMNQDICSTWVDANLTAGGTFTSKVDQTMIEYCRRLNTNDCACINAEDSVVFEVISKKIPTPPKCWWQPCQSTASDKFLIPDTARPPSKCASTVCISINNIFADDADLKQVTLNEFSNCGNLNPDKFPWYEQWWFWIIILTLVIIIFAIIIFYTSGAS